MKSKRVLYLVLALVGLMLVLAGIFLFPEDAQKRAAGACYGLGSAAFGLGAAWFAGTFIPKLNDEETKRRKAIDVADERNARIREKAGSMVEKCMLYGLSLWILVEGLAFGEMAHILPLIFLLVMRFVLMIIFTSRCMKTM